MQETSEVNELYLKKERFITQGKKEKKCKLLWTDHRIPNPLHPPAGSKGVLVTTKSKEQDNKTHIVLIVFTYTKNIKTGQSECTV